MVMMFYSHALAARAIPLRPHGNCDSRLGEQASRCTTAVLTAWTACVQCQAPFIRADRRGGRVRSGGRSVLHRHLYDQPRQRECELSVSSTVQSLEPHSVDLPCTLDLT